MEKILTDKELEELSHVVGDVEKSTSGELRLMIVERSATVGHVFQLLFALSIFGLFVVHQIARNENLFEDHWYNYPLLLPISFLLAWWLARFQRVQRMLTRSDDLESSVWARAELEFNREGLQGTKAQTGILIFLSLMEHQAVVLADKAIAAKLEPKIWNDVIAIVLEGGRRNQWRAKLEEAVRLCGKLLAQNFPAQPGDINELPNHVIVKP